MKRRVLGVAGLAAVIAAGSAFAKAGREPVPLTVAFADSRWTGDLVPKDQVCRRFGGEGATSPALKVGGAPSGTTAFRVLFNDESIPVMDKGGHGAVRYAVAPGRDGSAVLASVPAETDQLPPGVTQHLAHRAPKWSGTGGAYLPPCSGGRNNLYSAVVEALGPEDAVLGRGRIVLGRF